jgi:glycerate 2-kinase
MRIVIAPDKFKGSLSAEEVCAAIVSGVRHAVTATDIIEIPLADGGEGTRAILTKASGGRDVTVRVSDPLGRSIDAVYGISADGRKAFIEMSAASGLQLLKPTEHNPLNTSTVGTGELIRHALANGAREIVLGIGGSATNDMGIGMATVLGYRFLDSEEKELSPIGANLEHVAKITVAEVNKLAGVIVTVLCDVANPLYGEIGAAHIFAAQKGADAAAIQRLDYGLSHIAGVIQRQFNVDVNFPGAGAAGGLGAGAHFFLGGNLVRGITYVLEALSVESEIANADLVITGEGKLDTQSLSGKVISGVAALCQRHHKPFIIVTGRNTLTPEQLHDLGPAKVYALADITDESTAMAHATELISRTVAGAITGH